MFKPVNRYIQIEIPPEGPVETHSGILLPDDFKPSEDRYICVHTIAAADDVKINNLLSTKPDLIVDKSMIEEIKFLGKSINVILENYIVGVIHWLRGINSANR